MDFLKSQHLVDRPPDIQRILSPFRGLTVNSKLTVNSNEIVENLADYYEQHFSESQLELNNPVHQKIMSVYENTSLMPNIPLENKRMEELLAQRNQPTV